VSTRLFSDDQLEPGVPVSAERDGFAAVPVAIVAVAALLGALSPRYGFHRDELYFLVAGGHPAWGYADQPPLTPLIARASTALFGVSPAGLRVASTLACAATVLLTALIARELNGGRRAQLLAALSAAVSGFVLAVGHMVSTATFDLLAWQVVAWLALRLLRTGDGRWWLPLGAVIGLATLNKYLIGMLAVALLAGVLAVGPREALRGRWLVAGVLIAAVIAAPNLWWQAAHGWPQLTVAGGISSDDGAENRALFVPMQIVYLSPLLVPVWIAGIRHLWRDPALRWARSIVVAYPVLCVVVLVSGGKPYYALPLLLVLTAAGCEPLARWACGRLRVCCRATADRPRSATPSPTTDGSPRPCTSCAWRTSPPTGGRSRRRPTCRKAATRSPGRSSTATPGSCTSTTRRAWRTRSARAAWSSTPWCCSTPATWTPPSTGSARTASASATRTSPGSRRSSGTTSTCSAGTPSNSPSCPAACGPCAIRIRRTRSERRRRVRATVRDWSRGSAPTLSAR
jgi:hypothetical protein